MSAEAILDLLPVAAIVIDDGGTILFANPQAAATFGYTGTELVGNAIGLLLPQDAGAACGDGGCRPAATRPETGRGICARRRNGEAFAADLSIGEVTYRGRPQTLACIVDVTPHRRMQAALDRERRALRFLSGSNQTLLRATRVDTLLDTVCRLAVEAGGYRLAWVGRVERDGRQTVGVLAKAGAASSYLDGITVHWGGDPLGQGPTGRAIVTGAPVACRFIGSDPAFGPWRGAALDHGLESSIALPLVVEGDVFGALTLYSDAADAFDEDEKRLLIEVADDLAFGIETLRLRQARDQAETALRTLAHTDLVSGLENRAGMTAFLEGEFRAARDGALAFVGLEHFKEINNTLGYAVGDCVLRGIAGRLSAAVHEPERLARIGGGEFVVAMPGADAASAETAATRLHGAMDEAVKTGGQVGSVGAAIGIALYPGGRQNPDEVYADAGLAAHQAIGVPGKICRYAPEMSVALNHRRDVAQKLKTALAEGGLSLYYQPKVDIASGRLVGAEALLRWHDPALGPIGPDHFIPIAEERGLMPEIGDWVLTRACSQMAAWKTAGLRFPGRLAVNVSMAQFDAIDCAARVSGAVTAAGCSVAEIELEITESVFSADAGRAIGIMKDLRDDGFSLAIDDFGTGFSSLAYLSRMPVGTLKIDISFVRNMLTRDSDHVVIQTIINMARSLGLGLVAEGVETAAHAQALLGLGCPVAQGYHYGRPEPAADFARLWLRG